MEEKNVDVLLFGQDREFSRMLQLLLKQNGISAALYDGTEHLYKLAVYDMDTSAPKATDKMPIAFSRKPQRALPFPVLHRPFSNTDFVNAVKTALNDKKGLSYSKTQKLFYLNAVPLRLAPVEKAILFALYTAQSAVSREALEGCLPQGKSGALNVHICRLRKKLEKDGMHRLSSLRGGGYILKKDI